MYSSDALAVMCIFGLPVAAWITSRVLKHRERMAYIERGMLPPEGRGRNRGRGADASDRGWQSRDTWVPPPPYGAAAPPPYVEYDVADAQCTLRKGIVTAMIGFALVVGLSFIGYRSGDDNPIGWYITPGPWLIGGLVPMFVGIAQIIIAVLSGARLPGMMRSAPPRPPHAPNPPPYTGSGPFADDAPPYPSRPGVTYEELARPVKPPDLR